MGYARKTFGLKTVQELASVDGFFLWGCPYCETTHIVQAVDLHNEGKGNMPLADMRFQCPRLTMHPLFTVDFLRVFGEVRQI